MPFIYVDVHLKTILAVTLFRCARGSWLEDGLLQDCLRSEVHEIFMRIDMKHSYFSNYCLPSFFLLLKS